MAPGPADISVCVICSITDELCRSCKLENVVIFLAQSAKKGTILLIWDDVVENIFNFLVGCNKHITIYTPKRAHMTAYTCALMWC